MCINTRLQILAALFSIDDLTGFQITNLVELPEPYGIIFLWGAVFPALFIFVASITNFIFKDNLILKVCSLLRVHFVAAIWLSHVPPRHILHVSQISFWFVICFGFSYQSGS